MKKKKYLNTSIQFCQSYANELKYQEIIVILVSINQYFGKI